MYPPKLYQFTLPPAVNKNAHFLIYSSTRYHLLFFAYLIDEKWYCMIFNIIFYNNDWY